MRFKQILGLAAAAFFIASVAGAEDVPSVWTVEPIPGGKGCHAFLRGREIDTQIVRTLDGKLILVGGRPEWEMAYSKAPLTLQVDDAAAFEARGFTLGPTVFIRIDDGAQIAAMRDAHVLHWHLPWGDFASTATGLGAAFDKLGDC